MRNFKQILSFAFILALFFSCARELEVDNFKKGSPLELYVQFKPVTRLAELTPGDISNDNKGLKNVGLYMYYANDYNNNDLTKPYIRNLECVVQNGQLKPVTGENIYVYDKMVVVAFYPYNAGVANFARQSDEEAYPITRGQYADQIFIPYRAQTTIDPTVAYKVNLGFVPKHTSKIEIVIVGSASALPQLTNPKVLPLVDSVNAPANYDSRATMVDITNQLTNSGGGSYVVQYVAYVWSNDLGSIANGNNQYDNIINVGDPVFQSDELTLLATEKVNFKEDRIYRYGYNTVTGEVFIPTSSKLVNDIASFRASPSGYQVCDIDLSSVPNWVPVDLIGGSYDGGGHKITGLTINTLPVSGNVGLFGKLQGSAKVSNVNLVSPQITINAGTAAANVGALCGLNNQTLTLTAQDKAAMRAALVASLPPNVAAVVIDALLQDQILALQGGTSTIVGCKVSNAVITLTGKSLKAGLLSGINGDYKASANITDSYASGVINANVGVGVVNDTCFVAGLVGFNNANITRCYTTGTANAEKYTNATPPVMYNGSAGFCFKGRSFTSNSGAVTSCYTTQANTQPTLPLLSASWPSWSVYTGKWPVYNNTVLWRSMGSSGTQTPTLVWE